MEAKTMFSLHWNHVFCACRMALIHDVVHLVRYEFYGKKVAAIPMTSQAAELGNMGHFGV